jgi:uncharacterized protein with NAD-binding domain and iron-sulfur cluster
MAKRRRRRVKKVAIIGGGCAAMATAWELTQPALAGEFDVTVYQLGWRLGGKGASGRGANGRIEEHGLHLWMGHYDNAFRIMRDCYAELDRDPTRCAITRWQDAFVPDPYVGLADRPDRRGAWRRLMAHFPPIAGLPGDPRNASIPTTVLGYLSRTIRLLLALLQAAQSTDTSGDRDLGDRDDCGRLVYGGRDTLLAELERFLRYGQVASLTTIVQAVHTLAAVVERVPGVSTGLMERFLTAMTEAIHARLEPLLSADTESQYLWEIIDVVLAQIRGTFRFGLITDPRGFDAVNDFDARQWLMLNGAAQRSVNSAFVRGLYDLAFAYEDGDVRRPALAAGQGMRGGLRMFFAYRGSLFWKMQAGMGDVVFAPLFEVLRRRGVKFEFFHRLKNVCLGDRGKAKRYVTALEFDVQAMVRGGREYAPLVDVNSLPCWPAAPLWDQLQSGAKLKRDGHQFESFWEQRRVAQKTLHVEHDFDLAVLAVSIGEVPHVCREILARDRRWRDMVANVKTAATQCFQLWLNRDMADLGWHEERPNLSAFVEPFDTWADMTHLARAEDWPRVPSTIAYFCSVLPLSAPGKKQLRDAAYPEKHRRRVRKNAIRFLDEDIGQLWRNATRGGKFRWKTLQPAASGDDAHPFDGQFWTANVNPTDRYVLSLPGTIEYRISPLDDTYANLTIAGDWTDCGFNFGCVEAAVMSGRLAAHALAAYPALEDIDGYDHP